MILSLLWDVPDIDHSKYFDDVINHGLFDPQNHKPVQECKATLLLLSVTIEYMKAV